MSKNTNRRPQTRKPAKSKRTEFNTHERRIKGCGTSRKPKYGYDF